MAPNEIGAGDNEKKEKVRFLVPLAWLIFSLLYI